jgi:hypothetical protein
VGAGHFLKRLGLGYQGCYMEWNIHKQELRGTGLVFRAFLRNRKITSDSR